jgi:hypothetical protein
VPSELKGDFTARIKYEAKPFETVVKDATFTVNKAN